MAGCPNEKSIRLGSGGLSDPKGLNPPESVPQAGVLLTMSPVVPASGLREIGPFACSLLSHLFIGHRKLDLGDIFVQFFLKVQSRKFPPSLLDSSLIC